MNAKPKRIPKRAEGQVTYGISMPKDLLEFCDQEAARLGLFNRSAYIRSILTRERAAGHEAPARPTAKEKPTEDDLPVTPTQQRPAKTE